MRGVEGEGHRGIGDGEEYGGGGGVGWGRVRGPGDDGGCGAYGGGEATTKSRESQTAYMYNCTSTHNSARKQLLVALS